MKIYALMVIMALVLTGCGNKIPEMTSEEELAVGEYAAKLLLKYDANNRSRLVSREEASEWEKESEKEEIDMIQEPSQEGMDPVEDTPIIEIGQETSTNTVGSLEAFYELPEGVRIVYQGSEVCDSYSANGNDYFALDASEGNKLLILKFNIENQSQTNQNVDMLSENTVMHAILNGSDRYNILTTMLMDDMSTYIGEIPLGEKVGVVLLVEIDSNAADDISSLSLNLKNDSKKYTIQLQ